MGEEISKARFRKADVKRFGARLRDETALARRWFDDGKFSPSGFTLGFEIEAWLLDHNGFPHPINEAFLKTLNHPLVVPELSRFNVELNCEPMPVTGDVFNRAETSLREMWTRCNKVAHGLDANMVMIGTLPTIREKDLSLDNISPLKRYYALNNEVLRQRGGRPVRVDIAGDDHLVTEHSDVMLEAATTSYQIHIKVPAASAHRYLNASVMASAPVLAAGVNAPFLFGKALWDETRIPLFEQAIELGGSHEPSRRVTFGRHHLKQSLLECFEENLEEYPVLLPLCVDEDPAKFCHLRLHNGTIWRWNRPLLGFEADGRPHLRIEFRVLPAGPSIIDMIANTALYVGLVHRLATTEPEGPPRLSFEDARANFYAAARKGLGATLVWPEAGEVSAASLLTDALIPAARAGLASLGIDAEAQDRYLDIVATRIRSGRTGAAWQRDCLDARAHDFFEMMATYCERQRSGAPVHEWSH